jgi:transcriptional regulator with XRE-family HTH domain
MTGFGAEKRVPPVTGHPVRDGFMANLWRERRRSGLSQEELGFRAGLHRTEVGLLERGARIPRIDTLVKVAAALEVPPASLLDGITWQVGRAVYGSFKPTPESEGEEGAGGPGE